MKENNIKNELDALFELYRIGNGADSLDILNFAAALNDKYNLSLNDIDFTKLDNKSYILKELLKIN